MTYAEELARYAAIFAADAGVALFLLTSLLED